MRKHSGIRSDAKTKIVPKRQKPPARRRHTGRKMKSPKTPEALQEMAESSLGDAPI